MTLTTIADVTQCTSTMHDVHELPSIIVEHINRNLWRRFGGPLGCDKDEFLAELTALLRIARIVLCIARIEQ